MRRVSLLVGCVLLLVAFIVNGEQQLELEEALALFPGTDVMIEYSDEGRAQLEAAIDTFKTALDVPDDLDEKSEEAINDFLVDLAQKDLVNKLCQCYYTLADAFLSGEPNERETYLKGKHWGLKSLRMNSNFLTLEQDDGFIAAVQTETDVAALYWANANWLRASEFNKLEAIFAQVPQQTEAISLRLLELDETYMCYGPYRSLGAFWGGMPRLPGGKYRKNLEKARSYLCKVVDDPVQCYDCADCPADPSTQEYLENRLFYAEFYLKEAEKWEQARAVLEKILAEPLGENYSLYNAYSKHEAEILLERVNEHL
jgi:hypothetical protein